MDRRQIFLITLGLWLGTMAAFASIGAASASGLPHLWYLCYVAGVPVSGVLLSLVLQAGIRRLETRSLTGRWVRLVPLLLVIVVIQAAIDQWFYELMREVFGRKPTGEFLRALALNVAVYVWIFIIQALIFEPIAAMNRAARNARNAEEAREAARAAQLEALRNELNPHMLFNTFNGLSSLVLSGRNAEAEMLLERLSAYMRACLDGADTALVPLAEEIELVEAYLAIESVRFASTPDVRIDCPDDLAEAAVPRLILQPLVENALKYAVHPSRGAASVTVRAARDSGRLRLTVADTGTGAGAAGAVPPGTGRGLSIVSRRLETLFGADASVTAGHDQGGFRVEMLLPLSGAALGPAIRLR